MNRDAQVAATKPPLVRIAVLTYQRPQDIEQVLPRLINQARSAQGAGWRCDIVVVDNDPAGSAQNYVTQAAVGEAGVVVTYEHEPVPGISAARNRALDAAKDYDLLVFIDDDERPTPQWLVLMLETYARHRSAAVVGPVVSQFEVQPDAWVRAGRFFDRRRLPSGTEVSVAATNNLLLDLHQVRAHALRFDPEFGLSGGGDTLFTRELHRRGGKMIWCDEAVVIDVVPPGRATRSWVLRRALRAGTGESATSLRLTETRSSRLAKQLQLSARGAVRIAGGGCRLAFGVLTGSLTHQARGLRTMTRGAGLLSGVWGYQYREYQRTLSKLQ